MKTKETIRIRKEKDQFVYDLIEVENQLTKDQEEEIQWIRNQWTDEQKEELQWEYEEAKMKALYDLGNWNENLPF